MNQNREVCEVVNTTRGNQKLVIHGYLYVKDKDRKDSYYWCCEYRDTRYCNGRVVTKLEGQEHILKK
ncbi:7657_t:CDS:1, partial [Scutellospora calospora]